MRFPGPSFDPKRGVISCPAPSQPLLPSAPSRARFTAGPTDRSPPAAALDARGRRRSRRAAPTTHRRRVPARRPRRDATPPPPAPAPPRPRPPPVLPADPHRRRGERGHVPAEPTKIVSITPATTEILFALGAGDRLVGKARTSTTIRAEAAALPDVANVQLGRRREDRRPRRRPRDRRRQRLQPARRRSRSCAGSGSRSSSVYAPDVEGVLARHRARRRRRSASPRGRCDLTASMRAELRPGRGRDGGAAQPRRLYELDATNGDLRPRRQSFIAEMIALAGGDADHDRQRDRVSDPAGEARRRRPGGHRAGRRRVRHDARDVAAATRLGDDDRRQEGAIRPIDDMRRHAARTAARRGAAGPRARRSIPDLVLPPHAVAAPVGLGASAAP